MKFKFISILLLFISFVACKTTIKEEKPQAFVINDTLMKMIAFDTARFLPVEEEIRLIGKVSIDEEKVVRIFPLVSGYVTEVKVELGDYVEKEQVLAIVKSSEMAGAENDLVTAQSNLAIIQKNNSAMEDMYKSGITSEKEYIASQKDLKKAESELRRAESIMSIYGGSDSKSEYIIKAPVAGFIVDKQITPNTQLRTDNSNQIFTLSDLKHVWIIANVYEVDISKISLGVSVDVSTIAYPDKSFIGKIDKIYNILDPESKTMKIRIQLDNYNYLLKPGMLANIKIDFYSDKKMFSIPSNAIVFDKGKNFILVYSARDRIETRRANIYKVTGDLSFIESGINKGDIIITKNVLLVYNALNN